MSSNAQHSNLSSSTQSYQQSLRWSDLSIEWTKIDFNDEWLALKVPLPHSITAMTQQQADWILAHQIPSSKHKH